MEVNLIIPQYHSSFCIDNCTYCGFKKTNKLMPRHRLSDDDFKRELDLLIKWGYRTIEFVYASDNYFKPQVIAKRVEYAKEFAEKNNLKLRIGLNAQSFNIEGYKILKSAGLDFFVLWMETYSEEKFTYWHGSVTPKSNYEFRYNTYARAIEAGLTDFGMGVLFGLNDWQYEVNALINHANQLNEKYNFHPYIIGIPRIKQAHSVVLNDNLKVVSDNEFVEAVKLYKKSFPNTMLFFNTREAFDLNIACCSSKDLFTIDCGTYPGAYLNPVNVLNGFEQFHTHIYERNKIVDKLKQNDITPVFEW